MKFTFESGIKMGAIVISIQLLLSSCQPPVVEKVSQDDEKTPAPMVKGKQGSAAADLTPTVFVDLPVKRTITNDKGVSLEVTIIQKSDQSIRFSRVSDGKQYTLPIASLSAEDQSFLENVTSSGAIDPEMSASTLAKIKNIKRRIKYIDEDLAEFKQRIDHLNLSRTSPRLKGFMTKAAKLKAEKVELEIQLNRLQP